MSKNKLTQIYEENQLQAELAPPKPQGPYRAKVLNPLTDGNEHLREVDGEVETIIRTPAVRKYGITGTRHIEIAGRKYKLNRHDPFGFWYIVPENGGKLPEKLQGTYTSALEAEKALTLYINNLKM